MQGKIFDIQRFSIHDGPGIRTTVFLKGCPLNCIWCHNPESISFKEDLLYNQEKCIDCRACVEACSMGVHTFREGEHLLQRDICQLCGECTMICPTGALKLTGYDSNVKEILDIVRKDRDYYRESGGGLTISGGEPMAQLPLLFSLLTESRQMGLHTCLDTTGYAAEELFEKIYSLVDIFLFDYKATDPGKHRELTGVSNARILSNLEYLYHKGASIIIRCPLIPGINDTDDHLQGIADLSMKYPDLRGVQIMPYHDTGRYKYQQIGKKYQLNGLKTVDNKQKEEWLKKLRILGCQQLELNN